MRIKELLERDDAVSPVIGVILMVAITVILAAVIASFVLNLGDQAQQQTPTVSFDFGYDASNDGKVTITHSSGDTVEKASIDITASGTSIDDGDSTDWSGSEISAGDTYEAVPNSPFEEGDTVRITWTAESGGSSSTLAEFEVPSDSGNA